MSNLGTYQWITSTSKKVGGPINLLFLTGTAGAIAGIAIYKVCEVGVKKLARTIKSHQPTTDKDLESQHMLYSIIKSGISNEGIKFCIGDQYRVLEKDGDSVLIEKIGDQNNPYFASSEFLRTISDYEI